MVTLPVIAVIAYRFHYHRASKLPGVFPGAFLHDDFFRLCRCRLDRPGDSRRHRHSAPRTSPRCGYAPVRSVIV